jgi:hypothetical protein
MRVLGPAIGVIGTGLCLLGVCLWLLGGACDTSCGGSEIALLYLSLPGVVMAAVGLAIYRRWSRSA